MSSTGQMQIYLERQRKEQLRLGRLQKQAYSLLDACRGQIAGIKDPAIQQLAGPGLKNIQQDISQASVIISSDPDKAVKNIRKIQSQLQALLSKAQQKASDFTKEQAEAKSKLEICSQNLQAEQQTANEASMQELEKAGAEINKANQLYSAGKFKEVSKICDEACGIIEQAGKKAFDETVRREVVGSLLTTLTDMGFVVDSPVLEGNEPKSSKVKLTGFLPSGRKASFMINLDGRMEFDFDGYQGRACAKEMERIESQLNERFSVKLGPAQVTWKNPDKLTKGAVNLPASNSTNNL
ncbi:MAG: hypothetical protein ACYC54_12965 [Sedimentisphaerales bacterium]